MRTGDLPMTEAQARLLKRLCNTHGVEFDKDWKRGEAKQRITQLIWKDKKSGPPNMAA
jgi:hypothetical protein